MIRLIAAATLLALTAPAAANVPPPVQDEVPEPQRTASAAAFVESVYAAKMTAELIRPDLGRNTTSHIILYYFTPDLLALYKQAMEVPEVVIDVDMFLMAQEWNASAIKKSLIARTLSETTDGAADVEARFTDNGEERVVLFTLKKSPAGGWQIDNIADPKVGTDVRAMIARGLSAQ